MALQLARDQRHADAQRTWRSLAEAPLTTTQLVVAESHGALARAAGHQRAAAFLDSLLRAGPMVHWIDEETTLAAVDTWIRPFRDKAWSLTDAVSFEVMTRMAIRRVFTFDRHFEQAGFTVL